MAPYIIGSIIGLAIVLFIMLYPHKEYKKMEQNKENISSELNESGFVESRKLVFLEQEIKIDERNKQIAILYLKSSQHYVIPFSQLRSVSIFDSSHNGAYTIGAGGILGLASSVKQQEYVTSYGLNIYTTNLDNPLFSISMISTKTNKDSPEYKLAENVITGAFATLSAIIEMNK